MADERPPSSADQRQTASLQGPSIQISDEDRPPPDEDNATDATGSGDNAPASHLHVPTSVKGQIYSPASAVYKVTKPKLHYVD